MVNIEHFNTSYVDPFLEHYVISAQNRQKKLMWADDFSQSIFCSL